MPRKPVLQPLSRPGEVNRGRSSCHISRSTSVLSMTGVRPISYPAGVVPEGRPVDRGRGVVRPGWSDRSHRPHRRRVTGRRGTLGWRLVFVINIPIAAVVIALSRKYNPESRDELATGRLDLSGAVLGSIGLGGLIYGLTEGPANGWTVITLASATVGVLLLVVFVVLEGRKPNPLLPLQLFKVRQFAASNLVTLAVYAALAGGLFLLPVQLQLVAGLSPMAAGAATLPITVMMLLLSARMGRLSTRIGPRIPMTIGPIVAGAAMILLTGVGKQELHGIGAVK